MPVQAQRPESSNQKVDKLQASRYSLRQTSLLEIMSLASTNDSKDVSIDAVAVEQLNGLGYEAELRRTRGLPTILFMIFAIMSIPFAISTTLYTGLIGGGAATMIWGHTITAVTSIPVALSIAELASRYPTSGGTYYWTYRLAKPRSRALFSWINGWLFLVGLWTSALSATFGTAQLIVAGVNILVPGWVATPWQTYLIFLATELVSGICGVFLNDLLPIIDFMGSTWGILGTIVTMVCLLVKAAAGRRSAAFVFSDYNPSFSGWPSGWTFFIGLVPGIYTFCSVGALLPMIEEVHDPTINIPRATVLTIPIGYIQGLMYILAIFFTIPEIAPLLELQQPIAQVYASGMGSSAGGFGLWCILFGMCMFCCIPLNVSASRATWSFARDKAIPFHRVVSRVGKGRFTGLPVAAMLLSFTIQSLIGLIDLGSSIAFNAFAGIGVMSIEASFGMVITLSLLNGRKEVSDARFCLGRWGKALNIIAIIWICMEMVLLSMPLVLPVTATSMNYASIIFIGFACISAGYYVVYGRNQFNGPPGLIKDFENELKQSKASDEYKVQS